MVSRLNAMIRAKEKRKKEEAFKAGYKCGYQVGVAEAHLEQARKALEQQKRAAVKHEISDT